MTMLYPLLALAFTGHALAEYPFFGPWNPEAPWESTFQPPGFQGEPPHSFQKASARSRLRQEMKNDLTPNDYFVGEDYNVKSPSLQSIIHPSQQTPLLETLASSWGQPQSPPSFGQSMGPTWMDSHVFGSTPKQDLSSASSNDQTFHYESFGSKTTNPGFGASSSFGSTPSDAFSSFGGFPSSQPSFGSFSSFSPKPSTSPFSNFGGFSPKPSKHGFQPFAPKPSPFPGFGGFPSKQTTFFAFAPLSPKKNSPFPSNSGFSSQPSQPGFSPFPASKPSPGTNFGTFPSQPSNPSFGTFPSQPSNPSFGTFPSQPSNPSFGSFGSFNPKPSPFPGFGGFASQPSNPGFGSFNGFPQKPFANLRSFAPQPSRPFNAFAPNPNPNGFANFPAAFAPQRNNPGFDPFAGPQPTAVPTVPSQPSAPEFPAAFPNFAKPNPFSNLRSFTPSFPNFGPQPGFPNFAPRPNVPNFAQNPNPFEGFPSQSSNAGGFPGMTLKSRDFDDSEDQDSEDSSLMDEMNPGANFRGMAAEPGNPGFAPFPNFAPQPSAFPNFGSFPYKPSYSGYMSPPRVQ